MKKIKMNQAATMEETFKDFLTSRKIKGVAEKTLETYSSALHGAQDGQKFLALFLLGAALSQGRRDTETFLVPLWLLILCGGCMGLGTLLGGRRIIDRVGRDMVPLTPRLGLAADLAGNGALLLCTLLGLPVSTTHVKTAAILGSGGGSGIQWRVVRSIVLTLFS